MFVETTNGKTRKKLANVFSHPSELKTSPGISQTVGPKVGQTIYGIRDGSRSDSIHFPKDRFGVSFFASALEVGGGKKECVCVFVFLQARFFGNRGMKWLLL